MLALIPDKYQDKYQDNIRYTGTVPKGAGDIQSTPLHVAAIFGHERIIQLLLSHNADINSRNRTEATALFYASYEGHLPSVLTLLQAGADPLLPEINGALPIHMAAYHNHTEVVRVLIEQGGCSPDQVRHTALQSDCHRLISSTPLNS